MKISLIEAQDHLERGSVIAASTDTVFGLLAKADCPSAIEEIYKIKEREKDKPFLVLLPGIEWVETYAKSISPLAREIMATFWPGPLTIIFEANLEMVPSYLRRDKKTIALRVPSHHLLSPLLALTGPLVAPSLNRAGEKPLESVEAIEKFLSKEFPLLYDEIPVGKEPSTLIEIKEESVLIHREGAIPTNQLAKKLSPI
jgi:L-threonylcarbamoyladenylate synthase